eukprot:scaffold6189_cov101-Cylindrotheca_fusiformis.AAC.2
MERCGNAIINAVFEAHMPKKARPSEKSDIKDRLQFCQLKYGEKLFYSPDAAKNLVPPWDAQPDAMGRWSSHHDPAPFSPSSRPVRMPRRSSMPTIVVPFSTPKTTKSKTCFEDDTFEVEPASTWWEPGTPTSISTLSHSVSILSSDVASFNPKEKSESGSRRQRPNGARVFGGFEMPSANVWDEEDENNSRNSSPRSPMEFPSDPYGQQVDNGEHSTLPSLSRETGLSEVEQFWASPVVSKSRYPTRRASTGSGTLYQRGQTYTSSALSRSQIEQRESSHGPEANSSTNKTKEAEASLEEGPKMVVAPRRSRSTRRNSLNSSNHSLKETEGTGSTPRNSRASRRGSLNSSNHSFKETEGTGTTPRNSRATRRCSLNSSNHSFKETEGPGTTPRNSRATRRGSLNSSNHSFKETEGPKTPTRKPRSRRGSLNTSNHSLKEADGTRTPPRKPRSRRGSLNTSNHSLKEAEVAPNPRKTRATRRSSLNSSNHSLKETEGAPNPRKTRATRRSSLNSSNHSLAEARGPALARERNGFLRFRTGKQNNPRSIQGEESSEDDITFTPLRSSCRRLSLPGSGHSYGRQGLISDTPDRSSSSSIRGLEAVRQSLGYNVGSQSGDSSQGKSHPVARRRSSLPSAFVSRNDDEQEAAEAGQNNMLNESKDKVTSLKKLPPSLHVLLCKGSDDEKTFVSGITTGSSLESAWSLAKSRWSA